MERTYQFVGLKETAEGSVADDLVGTVGQAAVGVGEQSPVLVGEQEAGSDGIDAQALAELDGKFSCEPLCPAGHAGLGDAVSGDAGEGTERGHAAEIDDAALLLLYHGLCEDLGGDDGAEGVEVDDLAGGVDVQVEDGLFGSHICRAHVASCCVKEDVHAAIGLEDVCKILLENRCVEHVGGEEHRLSAVSLDFRDELIAFFGNALKVEEYDFAALCCEILYDGGSKHTAGAGHYDHAALDIK